MFSYKMDLNVFACGILAPISLLSQLILIYGYVRIEKMREHPDMMIFWHCVSEGVLDIGWILSMKNMAGYIPNTICQYYGAFMAFFFFLNWDYIVFLSIEILIKVKNPLNFNFTKRVLIYHISSIVTSLAIFLLLVSVSNNNGLSGMNTCFVQKGTVYGMIISIPTFVHVPICIACCCYIAWASRKMRHSSYARHHIYVVAAFLATRLPAALVDGLTFKGFHVGSSGIETLNDVNNR